MRGDIIISIIIFVLCLVLFRETRNYNYYSAIFPQFVLGLLMILSVALLIRALLTRRKHVAGETKRLFFRDLLHILIVVVLSFVWVYVMDRFLGFLLGSMVFGVLIFVILAGKSLRLKEYVLFSIALCVIVIIFWYALGKLLLVPLPTGLFF